MRRRLLHRVSAPVLAAMWGAACASLAEPRQAPFIVGVIEWRTAAALGVDARGGPPSARHGGADRAEVELTPATRVRRRGGGRATPADLAVGRTVSVWTTPMTRDSYPVLVEATLIIVEPPR